MRLKYAGPRPTISHHGISFKEGKEDKYVYLIIAIQILKAIDKNYDKTKKYSYDIKTQRISDDEMLNIILSYHPELNDIMDKEIHSYEKHLNEEIEQAQGRKNLLPIEKTALVNNLNIMKEYRIQRAMNKIFYLHTIQTIVEIIKREKIKEIDAPFYEKFWHVLQTIQGELARGRGALKSRIEVVKENGYLNAKLFIETL